MIKKITKTSIVLTLLLLSAGAAFAANIETNTENNARTEKYSALENKLSFTELMSGKTENATEKTALVIVSDDTLNKLEEITNKKDQSMKSIDIAKDVLVNRSGIKTFLIGNNLGVLKFQLVQIEDQSMVLGHLSAITIDNSNKIKIDKQIELLKEKQVEIATFITIQEKEFSLFGWLVKIL